LLRELVKRPDSGSPGISAERLAWRIVRPTLILQANDVMWRTRLGQGEPAPEAMYTAVAG
jgi:hypothetical protein